MLTLNADRFLWLFSNLNVLRGLMLPNTSDTPGGTLTLDARTTEDVAEIETLLKELGLGAHKEAGRLLSTLRYKDTHDMNAIGVHFGALNDRVHDDFSERCLLMLNPGRGALYEPNSPLWGPDIRARFPKACFDIDESGKCLAVGRYTASVFHLMRAVEIALKAIGKSLGIKPPPRNDNWGIWLGAIKDAITKRGQDRAWVDKDYYQDIYQRLDSVKDASRNPTMHVETIYPEEEAEILFRITELLFRKIASRMDQDGNPV